MLRQGERTRDDRPPTHLPRRLTNCSQSRFKTQKSRMQNDQGQPVDLYIPRKCSWTNRLIGASDQASVQINVGTIDPNTGLHTGGSETYALSGYVRNKGWLLYTSPSPRDKRQSRMPSSA